MTALVDRIFGAGVNSEDRLQLILTLTEGRPAIEFMELFAAGWCSCDDNWRLMPEIRHRLQAAKEIDFRQFLIQEDRQWFDGLPDRLKVYRGCERGREHGLSWTVDPDVAQSFARGHRGVTNAELRVVACEIDKRDVLFATNERLEFELLI